MFKNDNFGHMKTTLFSILALFAISLWACTSPDDVSPDPEIETKDTTKQEEQDTPFVSTLQFKSLDDLDITADHYHVGKDKPVLVLCHQAGWSRGEYKETAPKFNELGFNCIAIDQRSGGTVNDVNNETAQRAAGKGLPQQFENAEQDILAAIKYAADYYGKNVILLGSSYSSGLALKIANESELVDKVLSFSPGEYFREFSLEAEVKGLDKPTFITSAKSERGQVLPLFEAVEYADKVLFTPTGPGQHGSRALWAEFEDSEDYWTAVKDFLSK